MSSVCCSCFANQETDDPFSVFNARMNIRLLSINLAKARIPGIKKCSDGESSDRRALQCKLNALGLEISVYQMMGFIWVPGGERLQSWVNIRSRITHS